jgi:hypothetical protein
MEKYAKAECTTCGAFFEINATDDHHLLIFHAHGILKAGDHDFVGTVTVYDKPDKPNKKRAA